MSGHRTTPFDRPGAIVWLSLSFNSLSPNERLRRGLSGQRPGGHPFLIIKTYGTRAGFVLGCVCSKSYWVKHKAIPITHQERQNGQLLQIKECDNCRGFPENSLVPNARRLDFVTPVAMKAHSHVQLSSFAIVEKDYLGRWWKMNLQNDLVLNQASLGWILDQFAKEIAWAEQKSFLLRMSDWSRSLHSRAGAFPVRTYTLLNPNGYGLTSSPAARRPPSTNFTPLLLEAGDQLPQAIEDNERRVDTSRTLTKSNSNIDGIANAIANVWKRLRDSIQSLWFWR